MLYLSSLRCLRTFRGSKSTIFTLSALPTISALHSRAHSTSACNEFSPGVAESLWRNGYAVADDILTPETAALIREDIDRLSDLNLLTRNATHFVSNTALSEKRVTFRKRNVFEAELHTLSTDIRAKVPSLVRIEKDNTIRTLLNVYTPKFTLNSQALKVQRSTGDGACFPIHVDSATSVDMRKVTGILYVNEDWDSGRDGGILRLFPFPEEHVDVAPVCGRLVLLSSTDMLHRVLPSARTRYALTIWYSGSVRTAGNIGLDGDVSMTNSDLAQYDTVSKLGEVLLSPKYRALLARLVLAEEWDESLRQAHSLAEALAAIDQHARAREMIAEKLPNELLLNHGSTVFATKEAEIEFDRQLRELMKNPILCRSFLQLCAEGLKKQSLLQWFQ